MIQLTETLGGTTSTTDFSYDAAGRLASVERDGIVTATYSYDANGNRLAATDAFGTASASYDAQDRLVSYGGTSYAFDAAGDLTSKTQGSATVSYSYDLMSNLRHVDLPSGIEIDYVIDAAGRRVGKKVNGTRVQGFLYSDTLRLAAELDGGNVVRSRFLYASRANVPDAMIQDGTLFAFVHDHLGSPRLVVNTETGAIAQRLDYDAFGRILLDTNPGFQPFGFAGGLYDPQTGLVRFGARDYDPEVGRWTTKDPIGFGGRSANLFSYVGSDPLNFVDPGGLAVYPDNFVGPTQAGDLSVSQVANIVFNETRSIQAPSPSESAELFAARATLARVIINGSNQLGDRRPLTALPIGPSSRELANPLEKAAYDKCRAAAAYAFYAPQVLGFDPGPENAIHFNLRPSDSRGPFQRHALQRQYGPFLNSFPTPELPASGIYINAYD